MNICDEQLILELIKKMGNVSVEISLIKDWTKQLKSAFWMSFKKDSDRQIFDSLLNKINDCVDKEFDAILTGIGEIK